MEITTREEERASYPPGGVDHTAAAPANRTHPIRAARAGWGGWRARRDPRGCGGRGDDRGEWRGLYARRGARLFRHHTLRPNPRPCFIRWGVAHLAGRGRWYRGGVRRRCTRWRFLRAGHRRQLSGGRLDDHRSWSRFGRGAAGRVHAECAAGRRRDPDAGCLSRCYTSHPTGTHHARR